MSLRISPKEHYVKLFYINNFIIQKCSQSDFCKVQIDMAKYSSNDLFLNQYWNVNKNIQGK